MSTFASIRPHRSTTYIDTVCCYRRSNMVCHSVYHSRELCKKTSTQRDAVHLVDLGGPKEPYIRWGSGSLIGRDSFAGGKGGPLLSVGMLCHELCKNG